MSKNTRRLKVYYGHHGNSPKRHPVIRLAGEYLAAFDFKIGDKVEITMGANQIVISKIQLTKA